MGKYSKGLLGKFSGKVGTVVGGNWNGISYMRSLPEAGNNTPSEAQLIQRAKFSRVCHFLQPVHPILRLGFSTQIKQRSAINSAFSDTIKYAVRNDYPTFTVDYRKLQLAKGTLPGVQSPEVTLAADTLTFNWVNNSGHGAARADDTALLIAYGDNIQPSWTVNTFTRESGSGSIDAPFGYSGQEFHCYMAFISSNEKEVSNSLHVGTFIIP